MRPGIAFNRPLEGLEPFPHAAEFAQAIARQVVRDGVAGILADGPHRQRKRFFVPPVDAQQVAGVDESAVVARVGVGGAEIPLHGFVPAMARNSKIAQFHEHIRVLTRDRARALQAGMRLVVSLLLGERKAQTQEPRPEIRPVMDGFRLASGCLRPFLAEGVDGAEVMPGLGVAVRPQRHAIQLARFVEPVDRAHDVTEVVKRHGGIRLKREHLAIGFDCFRVASQVRKRLRPHKHGDGIARFERERLLRAAKSGFRLPGVQEGPTEIPPVQGRALTEGAGFLEETHGVLSAAERLARKAKAVPGGGQLRCSFRGGEEVIKSLCVATLLQCPIAGFDRFEKRGASFRRTGCGCATGCGRKPGGGKACGRVGHKAMRPTPVAVREEVRREGGFAIGSRRKFAG